MIGLAVAMAERQRTPGAELLNAVVLGVEFGAQVKAMFDKDLAASDPVTLVQWEQRPLNLRIKELLARSIEYWL